MSVVEAPVVPAAPDHPEAVGPIGRLGRFAADHVRAVSLAWAAVALALAVFAPQVETALSGAGWQANGSESVDARTLGALLALYEHRTFVEGLLFGINSFDQWGVELGKTLAKPIIAALEGREELPAHVDPSTRALVDSVRRTTDQEP